MALKKKFLAQQKEKLQQLRKDLRDELEKFAKENPNVPGDWNTIFPKQGEGTGSSLLEDATDEVEEYITNLPIEHTLETRLRDVTLALEKIKGGKYGICEKCGAAIPLARLEASPEARRCLKCPP